MSGDAIILSGLHRETLRKILMPYASAIDRVDVFGSRATGRARPNSDIDIAIRGSADYRVIARLKTLFLDSNLPVTVDVVAYDDELYAPLRAHIDAFARTLFTREDLEAGPVEAARRA